MGPSKVKYHVGADSYIRLAQVIMAKMEEDSLCEGSEVGSGSGGGIGYLQKD